MCNFLRNPRHPVPLPPSRAPRSPPRRPGVRLLPRAPAAPGRGEGGREKTAGSGGRSALPPLERRRLAAVGAGGRFVSALLPEPGRNADLSTPGFLRQKVSSAAKHAAKLAKEGPLAVGRGQPAAAPGGPRAAPLRSGGRSAARLRAERGGVRGSERPGPAPRSAGGRRVLRSARRR